VRAQQHDRVRLVGILIPFLESDPVMQPYVRAFREELSKMGWSEGGNVHFEERWTTDNMDRVRAATANLVELKPDVIVSNWGSGRIRLETTDQLSTDRSSSERSCFLRNP